MSPSIIGVFSCISVTQLQSWVCGSDVQIVVVAATTTAGGGLNYCSTEQRMTHSTHMRCAGQNTSGNDTSKSRNTTRLTCCSDVLRSNTWNKQCEGPIVEDRWSPLLSTQWGSNFTATEAVVAVQHWQQEATQLVVHSLSVLKPEQIINKNKAQALLKIQETAYK